MQRGGVIWEWRVKRQRAAGGGGGGGGRRLLIILRLRIVRTSLYRGNFSFSPLN